HSHRLAHVHGVRTHNPSHCLLVSIHVGSRDIFFRTNELNQLGGVAASHALKLAHGHLMRIADHTTLRPAERNVHHRALPRHPARDRKSTRLNSSHGSISYAVLC